MVKYTDSLKQRRILDFKLTLKPLQLLLGRIYSPSPKSQCSFRRIYTFVSCSNNLYFELEKKEENWGYHFSRVGEN